MNFSSREHPLDVAHKQPPEDRMEPGPTPMRTGQDCRAQQGCLCSISAAFGAGGRGDGGSGALGGP